MAADTTSPANGAQRGRGRPLTVTMRRTTAFAPLLEGIALADEVIAGATRIHAAVAIGDRALVLNEVVWLGHRAQAAREELRRLAGGLEE